MTALETEVWAADDGADKVPEWAAGLSRRLTSAGLLADNVGNQDSRRTLGDLNQRLRYVLGEHDDPLRTS